MGVECREPRHAAPLKKGYLMVGPNGYRRTMTDPATERAGLPHGVFLHRLAGASEPSALEPRLGRAAFPALRLVDLLGPQHATLHPDAFHYQHVATLRYCRDLPPAMGDTHSELLSRIGRAQALRGRGNLVDAEESYREILEEVERIEDRDAQARAHQELAVVLSSRGEPAEAIPHEWRAFQLYEDRLSRTRTLADLGVMLLIVGDTEGAERALSEVLRGGSSEAVSNASIELMNCASFRRDRVGFERWREQCDARRDGMPPNILADYLLKAGIGRARFGQPDRAERLLTSALRIADEAGLHEFTFRIERVKTGLRDCGEAAAEPVVQSEAVREVSTALAHLAGAT